MEVYIETTPLISEKTKSRARLGFQVLSGSLFLAACAQITIPFYPVPLTMQTLGIFLLALMQGSKKASCSTLLYLAFACMGLPILSEGLSQSLWMTLPSAGYLLSFPIAAFVIGRIVEQRETASLVRIVSAILLGQCIIYTLGILGLMRVLSFEQSVVVGLLPFLLVGGLKLLLASSFAGIWMRWKQK